MAGLAVFGVVDAAITPGSDPVLGPEAARPACIVFMGGRRPDWSMAMLDRAVAGVSSRAVMSSMSRERRSRCRVTRAKARSAAFCFSAMSGKADCIDERVVSSRAS